MSKNLWTMVLSGILFLLTGCTSLSDHMVNVRVGMTKEQILHLIGKPTYISQDANGDNWEYVDRLQNQYDIHALITFEDERVVAFRTFETPKFMERAQLLVPEVFVPREYPYGRARTYATAEQKEIEQFCEELKAEAFKDRQIKMLREYARNRIFTAAQCQQILSTFTFDEGRLEAMPIIAGHLKDREHDDIILKAFDFLTNSRKAKEILDSGKK